MATDDFSLRSPYPLPSHPDVEVLPINLRLIRFLHPGYSDTENMLFSFAASDSDGIHHETARLACAVVAGNRWDGFLCEDREGHQRATAAPDQTLQAEKYYFHLPDASDDKYAITPTFYHWNFPHGDLPKSWESDELLPQPMSRLREPSGSYCRMTRHEESVEIAHLVPAAQLPWFDLNEMASYTSTAVMDPMKHITNTTRLRSDVHTIFDAKRFTFVPKKNRWVVHTFNEKATSEVYRLYHNVPLQQLEAEVQLLFARFAYTVFDCLRLSLRSGPSSRKLSLRVGNEMKEQECTKAECVNFAIQTAAQGKSRSASPKKRAKPTGVEEEALEAAEATDEENLRGRKRRRSSSVSFVYTSLTDRGSADSIRDVRRAVAGSG